MTELIAKIVKWIWNKLLVLAILVLIFLGAKWFHSEWESVSQQLKQASLLEDKIENAKAEMSTLEIQTSEFGGEARKAFEEINSSEKLTAAAWAAAQRAREEYDAASSQVGWYQYAFDQDKVKKQGLAWSEFEVKHAAATALQKTTDALRDAQENAPWSEHQKKMAAQQSQITALETERASLLDSAGKTPAQKFVLAVREVLPHALWTLAGIIAAPFVIKAFLYFVLAPMISRARPVKIIPDASGDTLASSSHVSTSIELSPGDELIVHSSYLQAAGAGPGKKTLWIFSWRMPFTSIAAGLYAMVAVRNRSAENTQVTVSPKADLFDKVCDVQIPENGAMVIYPRSLIGMVLKKGQSPQITRRWNFSLHSWITFQFRYIIIHGPARLLIKGCRGVRAQAVTPTTPSMQDQLATLGFTANLSYSGVRCETFLDYLLGRDELFNDCFSDAHGYYLTEEVPNVNRKKGIFGRGLEGLIDGTLKAFGI